VSGGEAGVFPRADAPRTGIGGVHPATGTPGSADPCGFVRVHSGARLVVGAGCSLGCSAEELAALVDDALAHLDGAVVAVASVDRRAEEPCVTALAAKFGVPLRTFAADELKHVDVPTPSAAVHVHVGTPSVAEAAALLAAPGTLIVPKRRSPHATCAIAEAR
jgi:cobalamin biosynthesis protein CbiG